MKYLYPPKKGKKTLKCENLDRNRIIILKDNFFLQYTPLYFEIFVLVFLFGMIFYYQPLYFLFFEFVLL